MTFVQSPWLLVATQRLTYVRDNDLDVAMYCSCQAIMVRFPSLVLFGAATLKGRTSGDRTNAEKPSSLFSLQGL